MACGHVSDSAYTDPEGNRAPVCGKCYTAAYGWAPARMPPSGGVSFAQLRKDAKTVVPLKNLRGRFAYCWIGEQPGGIRHAETRSNINLNGFKYTPSKDVDTYYCGCIEKLEY